VDLMYVRGPTGDVDKVCQMVWWYRKLPGCHDVKVSPGYERNIGMCGVCDCPCPEMKRCSPCEDQGKLYTTCPGYTLVEEFFGFMFVCQTNQYR
jgi:hypothetical protein